MKQLFILFAISFLMSCSETPDWVCRVDCKLHGDVNGHFIDTIFNTSSPIEDFCAKYETEEFCIELTVCSCARL